MKVTTKSGSVYEIDQNLCRKYDNTGRLVDTFKVFNMKPIPLHVDSMIDVFVAPEGEPTVGQRLFLAGLGPWWLSTEVVKVEL